MNPPVTTTPLARALEALQQQPSLLGLDVSDPSITITFSDTRKRFTDFHRFVVTAPGRKDEHAFWLRHVKNKAPEHALAALRKQHDLFTRLLTGFRERRIPGVELSCCEPVALLAEHTCLITRECSGQIMNRYLVRRLPLLHGRQLLRTFEQVGIWLKCFHHIFRADASSSVDEGHLRQFADAFGAHPDEDLAYATLCHADFSPRNIFVDANFVQVIDLVGARPGVAHFDIAFFCEYIRRARFNGLYGKSFKERLLAAFVNAYRAFAVPDGS